MEIDFEPFFREYERLAAAAENTFKKMEAEYGNYINCKIECTDCCYALFDLSLIEAVYIHHRFDEVVSEEKKVQILERANQSDRNVYKIKKKAYKAYEAGKTEDEILEQMASEKVQCPLLNDDGRCELYAFRPITCRLYGIPTAIGGKGRTCGKSDFQKGTSYPTVNLDIIHKKLYEISTELARAIRSKYAGIGELLVPLSMALLTEYNEDYLGMGEAYALSRKKEQ